ncbi:MULTISPECIES: hypothetical protein [unclassified Streptomyces]|uniref:hypothetical protein n=1 Tax=unclassified Streptomyces TaxID=2593676 RepID=UPI000DC7A1B9|nr:MULTISPECIES: hypothetical protein [unclassified Streptomyces]AWZ03544.1 hypothetical protein DRB89_01645 [Streptomyces sp. ICC4]AWZ12597.1 hypothetical protein DRB96_09995 [Streptomyces sp. ICC1]
MSAYEDVLAWPLIVGSDIVSAHRALALVQEAPGRLELQTTCSAFDAVIVPAVLGADLLVLADRRGQDPAPVPSLVYGTGETVLLVAPGTAAPLIGVAGVRVESGPGGRIALPPSGGSRWDTWPWALDEPTPATLSDGGCLLPLLRTAMASTLTS